MTEAPHTIAPDSIDDLERTVAAWRADLAGQTSVSATEVQDRLLDLWAALPEGDRRSLVETWLTETLSRSLYAAEDLDRRLAGLAPTD